MLYAAPLVAPVGAKVVLEVETSSTEEEGMGDEGAGDVEWTASSGHIDDPVATETYFVCEEEGNVQLEVAITNEPACEVVQAFEVECVP
jgi:hypothetical protein